MLDWIGAICTWQHLSMSVCLSVCLHKNW